MWISERDERAPLETPVSTPSSAELWLASWIRHLAIPRSFWAEKAANRRIGETLATTLADWGYEVHIQGDYRNVVALPKARRGEHLVLVGAHYDSVPRSPGADDNASGVAVLLSCASALAHGKNQRVGFVAFNAEEDGLLGSRDFVTHGLRDLRIVPDLVHVLEMVGFRSRKAGSQRLPVPRTRVPALENALESRFGVGDFIGIIGNRQAGGAIDDALRSVAVPRPRCVALRQWIPLDPWLTDLRRSDHFPFWKQKIPALLWTDTANLRNPHYHRPTDLPDTLDYAFMAEVSNLLVASLESQAARRKA